ncbi:MAG: type IV secretory system conjugative DNA transfer family protein, partial [Acidobacteria bacterium]|nr:type IV secretory system conjugative DNA transfer family protein [Acidobacteriota bacterium]
METSQFEKTGAFYLGRLFDRQKNKMGDDLLLYDSKDLTTHAVCVGMTGSGKTGLCIGLLEEAAIDGIPAIIIDPKGDLGNLMLTFPDLKPENFLPWIDPDEAARKGATVKDYAAKTASLWEKGLAEWGQDGRRIQAFRDAADVAIYTPGSSSGLPLSILRSFDAPKGPLASDADALRDRVMSAVSGLLTLIGLDADPIQSREHILLSNILHNAWSQGKNLDIARLIQDIQEPPFSKVGVFNLDSFYPAKERFSLAMSL